MNSRLIRQNPNLDGIVPPNVRVNWSGSIYSRKTLVHSSLLLPYTLNVALVSSSITDLARVRATSNILGAKQIRNHDFLNHDSKEVFILNYP